MYMGEFLKSTFFFTSAYCFIFFTSFIEAKKESWTGRWLPELISVTENPKNSESLHTGKMGHKTVQCDDGKTNLTLDWNGSEEAYLCMNPRNHLLPDYELRPIIEYENIPRMYVANHVCMDTAIEYERPVPTYGPHRPLWPVYGEYLYLPKQRWVHSLEHGAIVLLYHPCVDPLELKTLKYYVRKCLRRYIITPSNELSPNFPLELVAWGVRFRMSVVSPKLVKDFIIKNALKGHEDIPDDGQYKQFLLSQSNIVSDYNDSILCSL